MTLVILTVIIYIPILVVCTLVLVDHITLEILQLPHIVLSTHFVLIANITFNMIKEKCHYRLLFGSKAKRPTA